MLRQFFYVAIWRHWAQCANPPIHEQDGQHFQAPSPEKTKTSINSIGLRNDLQWTKAKQSPET